MFSVAIARSLRNRSVADVLRPWPRRLITQAVAQPCQWCLPRPLSCYSAAVRTTTAAVQWTRSRRFTSTASAAEEAKKIAQFKIDQRLSATFTCTVQDCGTRSTHEFSRQSYEKSIVIVQCPGCKNRHLIADHLGWFKDSHEAKTVEEMVAAHGGRIRKGVKYSADGSEQGETIEIEQDSHPDDTPPPALESSKPGL